MTKEQKPLTFLIDPGTATAEELADIFQEISKLYRMIGGSGLDFKNAEFETRGRIVKMEIKSK